MAYDPLHRAKNVLGRPPSRGTSSILLWRSGKPSFWVSCTTEAPSSTERPLDGLFLSGGTGRPCRARPGLVRPSAPSYASDQSHPQAEGDVLISRQSATLSNLEEFKEQASPVLLLRKLRHILALTTRLRAYEHSNPSHWFLAKNEHVKSNMPPVVVLP